MRTRFSRLMFAAAVTAVMFSCSRHAPAAQTFVPGQSYFGRSNYIEYIAGDLPVIVSAPHGGLLTPEEIPDRTNGVLTIDAHTQDLARKICEEIRNRVGHVPHVILCRLHREKLDCNRDIGEGAQGDPEAEQAWHEFQDFIIVAKTNTLAQFGSGFYVDLHGHGHTNQRLELGYLLSAAELANSDATLNSPFYENQSSIRTLSQQSPLTFPQLLRGSHSLGALVAAEGYPAVPSPDLPDPGTDPYFNGGYNTVQHGSMNGGNISGLQIECNMTGVRDYASNRTAFAQALAQVTETYLATHYGISLRQCVPSLWPGGGGSWSNEINWYDGTALVSSNHLVFAGGGGTMTHDVSALATGQGVIGSLAFSNTASGAYTLTGNAFSLIGGITNDSPFAQTIQNPVTLIGPQTFAANSGALIFPGGITSGGNPLTAAGNGGVILNGTLAGGGSVNLAGRLGGTGMIAGPVSGNGIISPGQSVGTLGFSGGLDLSSGGTYVWELAALSTNGPGTAFDELVLSGGNLALGGTAKLQLVFTGSASAPQATNVFWQGVRSWRIITLTGSATNSGTTRFPTLLNANFAAGAFTNYPDGAGNIWLKYLPASAHAPPQLDSRIVGAGTSNAIVAWFGVEGQVYQLQCKDDLTHTNWTILGTLTAPTNFVSFPETNGPREQRFYRVVIPAP